MKPTARRKARWARPSGCRSAKRTNLMPRRPSWTRRSRLAKVIREHDLNQMFVAFTATPAPATVTLFGEPFDTYTEAEAIAEGYIVDVAASIISYKTLYNLHCPFVPPPDEEKKLYPKGVVSKALHERGVPGRRPHSIQGRGDAAHLRGGRDAAHRRTRQGDDRDQFPRRRAALFPDHQGKAQGARRELQSALRLLGFRPSRRPTRRSASTPSTN